MEHCLSLLNGGQRGSSRSSLGGKEVGFAVPSPHQIPHLGGAEPMAVTGSGVTVPRLPGREERELGGHRASLLGSLFLGPSAWRQQYMTEPQAGRSSDGFLGSGRLGCDASGRDETNVWNTALWRERWWPMPTAPASL